MKQSRPDFLAFGRPSFSEKEIEAVARVLRSGSERQPATQRSDRSPAR